MCTPLGIHRTSMKNKSQLDYGFVENVFLCGIVNWTENWQKFMELTVFPVYGVYTSGNRSAQHPGIPTISFGYH